MSAYDPVAFTGDADIWCPACAVEKYGPELDAPRLDDEGNEVGAIFSTSFESDVPETCAGCDGFLENDLTGEGVRYVANLPAGPFADEWRAFYGIAGGWAAAPHVESGPDAGKLETYAWPGGYPLYYVVGDDDNVGTICPECAQGVADSPGDYSPDQFRFRSCETNWEDPDLYCDHCDERIPSAYGDPNDDDPRPAPIPVIPGQTSILDADGNACMNGVLIVLLLLKFVLAAVGVAVCLAIIALILGA